MSWMSADKTGDTLGMGVIWARGTEGDVTVGVGSVIGEGTSTGIGGASASAGIGAEIVCATSLTACGATHLCPSIRLMIASSIETPCYRTTTSLGNETLHYFKI